MDDGSPKILQTNLVAVSPWLNVITRDVQFSTSSKPETYYSISQPDYLVAVAVTPDSRIPLVRQYRPAIERFSLELPAGMLEPNEDPAAAMARELMEETGYPTQSITLLGTGATCSSRISNTTYAFFIRTGERNPDFVEEAGVAVEMVSLSELRASILSGAFSEQTHLGVLAQASLRGLLSL